MCGNKIGLCFACKFVFYFLFSFSFIFHFCLLEFTSTCKAFRANFDCDDYWYRHVASRFATKQVPAITLSSAIDFYTTHSHFRESLDLPPLSLWKYVSKKKKEMFSTG